MSGVCVFNLFFFFFVFVFSASLQAQCEPQSYTPMDHKDFREDLKKFRHKSKTWAGERSKLQTLNRLRKL